VARRQRLMSNVQYFKRCLGEAGFRVGDTASAIVPIPLGSETFALDVARRCNLEGLYAIPVLSPAVPRGAERLRMNIACEHQPQDLEFAVSVLEKVCSLGVSSVV